MDTLQFLSIKQIVTSLNVEESKALIKILNDNIVEKQTYTIKERLLKIFQRNDLQIYLEYIEKIKSITYAHLNLSDNPGIRIEFADYAIEIRPLFPWIYRYNEGKWKVLNRKRHRTVYDKLSSFGKIFKDEKLTEKIMYYLQGYDLDL